jgi:hypothetical protein
MSTTPSLRLLSRTMTTSFLVDAFPVYQSLEAGIFHLLCLLPLPFCLLNVKNIHTSPNHDIDYLSKLTRKRPYISGTYTHPTRLIFLILHIRRVKCEDACSFFTTPGRRCSASLRMRRSDPCSLNTVSRST